MSGRTIVNTPSPAFLAEMHEIQMANLHRAMASEDGADHSDELKDNELSHLDYDAVKNGEQDSPYIDQD